MNERLRKFIELQDISVNEFCKLCGLNQTTVASFLRKNSSLGSEILLKISYTYPFLNLDWLITGRGSMLYGDNRVERVVEMKNDNDTTSVPLELYEKLQDRVCELNQTIGELRKTIEVIQNGTEEKPSYAVHESSTQKKRSVRGDI